MPPSLSPRPARRPDGSTRPWVRVAAAALLAVVAVAACGRREPPETFHGVRLGMTPGDVRARFQPPRGADGPASWRSVPGGEGTLEYSVPSRDVPNVRFEFHSGMLVAVRATLEPGDSASRGARRDLHPGSVLVRAPRGSAVEVTWLSRDCPTHKLEADRLAQP